MSVPLQAAWWMPPLFALQFLTRIPTPCLHSATSEQVSDGLARARAWFPLVGGLIGLSTALLCLGLQQIFPLAIAVLLALAFEAWLTGAFHEDAVADFCDAFGGGHDREHIARILKDSRIGTYGAVGLGFAVALRAGCLMALPTHWLLPAVMASASFGRFGAVCLVALAPPVTLHEGQTSIAKDIGGTLSPGQQLGALIALLPNIFWWLWLSPVALCVAIITGLLFLLWFKRYLIYWLGGSTGDCLGFATYAIQLITLLCAVAWV